MREFALPASIKMRTPGAAVDYLTRSLNDLSCRSVAKNGIEHIAQRAANKWRNSISDL